MLLCSAVKEEGAHSVEWQRVKGFSTKQLDFGSASGDFAAWQWLFVLSLTNCGAGMWIAIIICS